MIFALVQILGYIVLGNQTLRSTQILFWVMEAGIFLLVTHVYRTFIVKWGWLDLSMERLIYHITFSVCALALFVYFVRVVISLPLEMYDPNVVWEISNMIGLTFVYALIFFLWSAFYFTYHYFERYNLSLQHEAAIIEIELKNLRSQLNPHFIFNALNSIKALIDENPGQSRKAINQLANILRNSLISDKKRLTKFEDEFKIVKDYLSLERVRFEERLRTAFEIHPDSKNFLVPPLMLQTLVENGIKHGISKLKEGGIIMLQTDVSDLYLKIQIRNSGQVNFVNGSGMDPAEGLGLKNTRQRLKLLYGNEAEIRLLNEPENMVLTELVIPKIEVT